MLDLREASVPAGEIVIDARSVFGDVELLVPEGVLVEVRGRVFFGDVKQEAGLAATAGAPRIVLDRLDDLRRRQSPRQTAARTPRRPPARQRLSPYPSRRASSSASPRSSCARSASPTRS